MLNITSIEDAIRKWIIDSIPTIKAIFAHPNAPRPTTSYALINLLQNTPKGVAEKKIDLLPDDSIDITYSNVEELFVSINVYYDNAYQNATKLKDTLARVTITDDLYSAGLGYLRASNVRDIPEMINKQWEQRAQFDVFFSVRSEDVENIENIRKIEFTNLLNGDNIIVQE